MIRKIIAYLYINYLKAKDDAIYSFNMQNTHMNMTIFEKTGKQPDRKISLRQLEQLYKSVL